MGGNSVDQVCQHVICTDSAVATELLTSGVHPWRRRRERRHAILPRLGGDSPIRAPGDTLPADGRTTFPTRMSRAPVPTLWATVVAERLGYPPETGNTRYRKD
jgi:hypothetical protein